MQISESISLRIQPTTLFNANHGDGVKRESSEEILFMIKIIIAIQYTTSSVMSGDVAKNRS